MKEINWNEMPTVWLVCTQKFASTNGGTTTKIIIIMMMIVFGAQKPKLYAHTLALVCMHTPMNTPFIARTTIKTTLNCWCMLLKIREFNWNSP